MSFAQRRHRHRSGRGTSTAALLLALAAGQLALADPFLTRRGTSGILDVSDGEVLGFGEGSLSAEVKLERSAQRALSLGASDVAVGIGVGRQLELGIAAREGGQPGDPSQRPPLVMALVKYQAMVADRWSPALAFEVAFDRINLSTAAAVRVSASTEQVGGLRFAAFGGGELTFAPLWGGPSVGFGAVYQVMTSGELAIQGLYRPGGVMVTGSLRYALTRATSLVTSFDWLPAERGYRVSVGFALLSMRFKEPKRLPDGTLASERLATQAQQGFATPFPRFKLRIHPRPGPGEAPTAHRHVGAEAAGTNTAQATITLLPEGGAQGRRPTAAAPNAPDADIAVRSQLAHGRVQVDQCVQEQRRTDPDTVGGFTLRIVITPEGAIESVEAVDVPPRLVGLGACLESAARSWHLPERSGRYQVDLPVAVTEVEVTP